jgi:hypothetical protein
LLFPIHFGIQCSNYSDWPNHLFFKNRNWNCFLCCPADNFDVCRLSLNFFFCPNYCSDMNLAGIFFFFFIRNSFFTSFGSSLFSSLHTSYWLVSSFLWPPIFILEQMRSFELSLTIITKALGFMKRRIHFYCNREGWSVLLCLFFQIWRRCNDAISSILENPHQRRPARESWKIAEVKREF